MDKVTYENCYEEAKKYKLKKDFKKNNPIIYKYALRKKWIKDYTWLIEDNIYKNKVDAVYCYLFNELNAVYVGRTLMRRINIRDWQHRNSEFNGKKVKPDSVNRFANEHNIDLPLMTILEKNLTLEEGQKKKEGIWLKYFKEKGYHIINIAKTGSLGTLNKGIWNYKNCYEEAKKYKYKIDFIKGSNSAYDSARRHGWLKEYIWLNKKNLKWTEENCYEEAKKYNSRLDFSKGNYSAYDSARRHGWLNDYTWFSYYVKWTEENCYEAAKKYNSKIEFKKGEPCAYAASCKNKWINTYTWFIKKHIKWTEENCYEEAKKYNSKGEFQKGNKSAYVSALNNGWIEKYEWFIKKHKTWTKESCYEEAKKYNSKIEFNNGNQYAYKIAKENKWIKDYVWFKTN